MTVSIGAITLSDHLLVPELKNMARRVTSTRYTMGGRAVIQSAAIANGQQITLVDEGPLGVLTGTQIDAINAYQASGEVVTFVHHTGTWRVIVLAVEVEQGIRYADPIGADTYFGRITMQITG